MRWSDSWCDLVSVTKLAGPNCVTISGTYNIILIAIGRYSFFNISGTYLPAYIDTAYSDTFV